MDCIFYKKVTYKGKTLNSRNLQVLDILTNRPKGFYVLMKDLFWSSDSERSFAHPA